MNLYLDASALVKRYLSEPGTPETRRIGEAADVQGTTIVSRVEVSAALAKSIRTETLTRQETNSALKAFRNDWINLYRLYVSNAIAALAEELTFEENLRGYDAVQLASALAWKEGLAEDVTFATFDVDLWEAAGRRDLVCFPEDLPGMLATWRQA